MELGLSLGDAAGSSKAFQTMEKPHTHTRIHTSSNKDKGIGFCMELSIGPTSSVREDGDDDSRRQTQEDEDHHLHHHEDKQTTAAARLVDSAEKRCSTETATATAEAANIIQQLDLLPNTPVVVPFPRNPTPSSILAAFPAANWTSAGSSEAAGSGQMARDANKLPMAIPAPLDLLVLHDRHDDEDSSSPEAEDGDGGHGAGALSSSSSLNTNNSAHMDFRIYGSNHHHNHTSTAGSGGTSNIKKSSGDIFRASNYNNNEVVDGCSEPEDENGCSTRKKLRLSKQQSAFLEESFKEHTTLTPKQKLALAKQLNLRPRQVEVWFQNRRARTKLKQTEVDCEYLKRCCETLTEENRRLQKELQELRALKSTACSDPFFTQLPATTLTMCPSCERVATNINPPPLPTTTTTTTTPPKATSTSTGSLPLSTSPTFVPFSHRKPTTTAADGQI